MAQVLDPLVEREPGAGGEDEQRHDEAPEIDFLAVAERKARVGRPLRAAHAVEQQRLVAAIHHRVDAFGPHRGAAGDTGGDELGHRDGEVARQRGIDDVLTARGHARISAMCVPPPTNWCHTGRPTLAR